MFVCVCMCVCLVHQRTALLVGGVMSERPTDCQLCLRVRRKKNYTCKEERGGRVNEGGRERRQPIQTCRWCLFVKNLHQKLKTAERQINSSLRATDERGGRMDR